MNRESRTRGLLWPCLVFAVLGFLASARGLGQTVTTIDSTSAPSRAEVFTGYSFFSPFGSDINNYPYARRACFPRAVTTISA
jgi:hypothetical protein